MKRKKLLLLFVCLLAVSFAYPQTNLYDLSVTTDAGASYGLAQCQGRRIWVVILPATQTHPDSLYLARVDSLAKVSRAGWAILAVPSLEDGYLRDTAGGLSFWYRQALDSGVVLLQPVYTHKGSGGQQTPLFQWLTKVANNTHFDDDVDGPCQSFFIDAGGMLYGVLNSGACNSNNAYRRVLPYCDHYITR